MFETNDSRNNVSVNLKLSIGQCKLINRSLDNELRLLELDGSTFNQNRLKRLLDTFSYILEETPEEKAKNDIIRAEKFEAWASKSRPEAVQHG